MRSIKWSHRCSQRVAVDSKRIRGRENRVRNIFMSCFEKHGNISDLFCGEIGFLFWSGGG